MEHSADIAQPISVYREFAPCPALQRYVRALAWYGPATENHAARSPMREFYLGPDRVLSPTFADVQTSLLFALGASFDGDSWRSCAPTGATLMGALPHASQPRAERLAMIGVYFRPGGSAALLGLPAAELTGRVVPLSDLLPGFDLDPEQLKLAAVEAFLVRQTLTRSQSGRSVHAGELASYVLRSSGRPTVREMADLAGLSRQHLGRVFHEQFGLSPKLFARLARFRGALRHVRKRERCGGWSGVAATLGYVDQSHMIAEFREFALLTPEQLARADRFHPFIGDG